LLFTVFDVGECFDVYISDRLFIQLLVLTETHKTIQTYTYNQLYDNYTIDSD